MFYFCASVCVFRSTTKLSAITANLHCFFEKNARNTETIRTDEREHICFMTVEKTPQILRKQCPLEMHRAACMNKMMCKMTTIRTVLADHWSVRGGWVWRGHVANNGLLNQDFFRHKKTLSWPSGGAKIFFLKKNVRKETTCRSRCWKMVIRGDQKKSSFQESPFFFKKKICDASKKNALGVSKGHPLAHKYLGRPTTARNTLEEK